MKTRLRPMEKSNPYWISKNRYLELRYFCLQYSEWQELYNYALQPQSVSFTSLLKYGCESSVEKIFDAAGLYKSRMEMIKNAAHEADSFLGDYIFKAVTEDRSFTYLEAMLEIPCSKKMYYNRYHKFFYILSNELEERERQGL